MKNHSLWFETGLRVLAAIGLFAVLFAAVLGIRKLAQYRAASPSSGETAAVAVTDVPAPATTSQDTAVTSQSTLAPAPAPSRPASFIGVPDLLIQIVDTGIINEATNEFVSALSVSNGQQAAIVFEVVNIGTAVSERWQFAANLPSLGGNFVSQIQPALSPGDRLRFTIGFRELSRQGENKAVITIDPQNQLQDKNRQNDSTTATLIRNY